MFVCLPPPPTHTHQWRCEQLKHAQRAYYVSQLNCLVLIFLFVILGHGIKVHILCQVGDFHYYKRTWKKMNQATSYEDTYT